MRLNKHLTTFLTHQYAYTIILSMMILSNTSCTYRFIGGNFEGEPHELNDNISVGAKQLIETAFADIDGHSIHDYHVHVVGVGDSDSGIYLNEDLLSWLHPVQHVQYEVYKSASGISEASGADDEYITRLVALIEHSPFVGKFHLLAFDKFHDKAGQADNEKTQFYVPNEYVIRIAKNYPQYFIPVGSVHPYRSDALAVLDKLAAENVKMIKWLPNVMGIDPADPDLYDFYAKMKQHNITLLTHTGQELALAVEGAQSFGNPLKLRFPLELGVKVIAAHSASLGESIDLDAPDEGMKPSFELFMRMMDNPAYEGLLFGEISALTFVNRDIDILKTLLERTELHHRLVNGSDYPLPAVNVLVQTSKLVRYGLITALEAAHLKEIYAYNPLLFDFVLKRTLRHPESHHQFSKKLFTNELE